VKEKPLRVYISTAERSGMLYAGHISQKLEDAGAEVVWPASFKEADAPVGFREGLKASGSVLARMKRVECEVRRIKPDVFLAVAWSEPNTILGVRLRDLRNMRRVFFAPPQLWAWGRFRAALLRKGYDALICLYPKEAKFLKSLRLPACFRGNPLARHLALYLNRGKNPSKGSRTIALLAGSRQSEQARHMGVLKTFRDAWRRLYPKDRFCWLFLTEGEAEDARIILAGHDKMITGEERYRALASADLAIVTSGTASLETALLGTPQVVFYSLPSFEVFLVRSLTRVKRFALPNLILGDDVVPETLNPSVETLLEHSNRAILNRKESEELAARLIRELAEPLDNCSTLFRIILSSVSIK
jgi:lipid-A-disaccharide synthase